MHQIIYLLNRHYYLYEINKLVMLMSTAENEPQTLVGVVDSRSASQAEGLGSIPAVDMSFTSSFISIIIMLIK